MSPWLESIEISTFLRNLLDREGIDTPRKFKRNWRSLLDDPLVGPKRSQELDDLADLISLKQHRSPVLVKDLVRLKTTFSLDTDLVVAATEKLAERGLSLTEYLSLHLRLLVRSNTKVLGLDDALPFGKFAGERVETVARAEPGYILWLIQNAKGRFDEPTQQLIDDLTN